MAKTAIGQQKRIPQGQSGGGRWTKGNIGFGGALGDDTDKALSAWQDHRRVRVKLAKLKRKVGTTPTAVQQAQMNALAADVARYKADFKKHQQAAKKAGVAITSSGDVVAGGKQYAKGGKIVAKPSQPAKAATPVTPKPVAKPAPKPPTVQQQIDDGIDAFKEHRKWRVKAISLKKKAQAPGLTVRPLQRQQIMQQLAQATQKRDAAKAKLDSIRKQLNATGNVKFKSNGDVEVNGTQTHKGGTVVGNVKPKAAVKPAAPKPAATPVAPKPAAPSKPKRPPRKIAGLNALSKAHSFMSKHYGQWLNNLSNPQVKALRDYIGFPSWMSRAGDPKFYDKLNRALVGERNMTAKMKTAAKHLDAAIAKTATPYDMILHRGLNSQTVYTAVKTGKFDDSVMNSAKATKRYISTSLEPDTAKGFMQYKPGVGWVPPKHPVFMEIEAPKGTHAAALSFQNRLQNPYAAGSSEMLLARGTQYDIIEAKMINEPGVGQVAYIKARIRSQP